MDIQDICETVLEELNNLIKNPGQKSLSDEILLVKSLRRCFADESEDRTFAHQDSICISKNVARKNTSVTSPGGVTAPGSMTPSNHVTSSSHVTSPLENEIITLDDFEFQDDVKINPCEGVFKNLKLLENHPAHLAIFIQYLISYATPHPILYDLICKHILKFNKAELIPSTYALYCNFLADNAPLKIDIDNSIVKKLFSSIQKSTSSDDNKDIVKHLQDSLILNENFLLKLLKEFNEKRAIGLGVFYGENYLHDKLDEKTSQLIIAETLWKNFEKNFLDFSNEICCSLAAALASVLRILNFQPKTNKNYLDICSHFFSRHKSKSSNVTKDKFQAPFLALYGHNCTTISFSGPVNCCICAKPVCHVGNVGYSCKNCKRVFHKICLQLDSTVCHKSKDINNDDKRRILIIGKDEENTDSSDVTDATNKRNRSSKIKVFCRASVDPVQFDNIEFFDSDLEYDDSIGSNEVTNSARLSAMSTLLKRKHEALNEFCTTERYHVRSLKIMFNVFYIPMCRVCDAEFVKLVFPNLKSLIQLHVNLNDELKAMKGVKEDTIVDRFSDVLVKHFTGRHGERLEESTALFCQKQSTAVRQIDRMQKINAKFNQIITAASNNKRCRRLNLKDFIPTIIQRFTKYPLLVDNVIKYTPNDTPAYAKLQLVYASVRNMVQSVDTIINDYTKMQYANYLTTKIEKVTPDPAFMHPSVACFTNLKISNHQLLHFGDMRWVASKSRTIDIQLLLFNDIILVLQKVDKRLLLKFERSLTCEKMKSYTVFSPILKLKDILVKSVPYDNLAFYLVCISTKQPQMFHMLSPSIESKNLWFQRMQTAREKLISSDKNNNNNNNPKDNKQRVDPQENKQYDNDQSNVRKIEDVDLKVYPDVGSIKDVDCRVRSDVGRIEDVDSKVCLDDVGRIEDDILISQNSGNVDTTMFSSDSLETTQINGQLDEKTLNRHKSTLDGVNGRLILRSNHSSFVQDPRLDFLREVTSLVTRLKIVLTLEKNETQELFLHALKNIQNLSDDQVVNISKVLREQITKILDQVVN